MAAPSNVELEAAKFLHKLIQESKDEPTKLATKLYVILQHMRSSGKENSMPYQVISRAMETVINQHGLDIDALMSSRIPLTTGAQVGDSASSQFGGLKLRGAIANEASSSLASSEQTKVDAYASNRQPVGPSSAGHDIFQVSVSHLNSKSLDHESPSSFDTRPAKSQSEERFDSPNWEKAKEKDNKKVSSKRKRVDPSLTGERQFGNLQTLDSSTFSSGMDKVANKIEQPRSLSIQGGEHGQSNNMIQSSSQTDHSALLTSAMKSVPRAKQETKHQAEKSLDSANVSTSLSRASHSRHPEEIEVSSTPNALGLQQGGSLPSTHDVLNSRGLWNQNKIGLPYEKSQVPRFSFHAGAETLTPLGSGAASNVYGMMPGTSGLYVASESGIPSPAQFSSSHDTHGLGSKMPKDRSMGAFSSVEFPFEKGTAGKALEHEGGMLHSSASANNTVQVGMLNSVTEMTMLRSTGKSPVSQAPSASGMPFKEQHLKQLRAQCLVFLAFRSGLMPKKLHLDIALGNLLPREDGPSNRMIDHNGKEQSIDGLSSTPNATMPFGRLGNPKERSGLGSSSVGMFAEGNLSKEGDSMNMVGDKNGVPFGVPEHGEERGQFLMTGRKPESEMQTREIPQSQLPATRGDKPDGLSLGGSAVNNHKDDLENRHRQVGSTDQASLVMGMGQQMKTDMSGWTGSGCNDETSKASPLSSAVLSQSVPERKDNAQSQFFSLGDHNFQGSRHADACLPSFPLRVPVSRMDSGNLLVSQDNTKISHQRSSSDGTRLVSPDNAVLKTNPFTVMETDQEEGGIPVSTDLPLPPKYTTCEKWITDQQKRKLLIEKTWALKQQKTEQRITACSDKLKDTVSSSEDISAKTRSVIELKKLQLLELQRRLKNDILNDFFKPISSDMDRLKSIKKHRIGRRSKQLEKFEQKMKEERQKRFRERQKEFFSEIEVHKERLEDVFKMRRERWKGFNKYVREFHKRKERAHREKIDRIQREKINLLKINDVEGYLRMVQDAKSDRVKQLLKETEKYLQKLGSKLRDAKAMSRCFETEMDDNRNDMTIDNEDETDQAKHYLESNEKYYLMAHSIKENVADQPSSLVGGKLREYQMNGLRWLVSLYNNHLNGILADEMGLGKTVQVISLICYLMENKNDRGPFLVVVPSSVLPGWDSEINFWAPSINKIVYSGPPEERRRLFKERIVPQKFNVLLTTYEYLMNKHDRPKLSKIHWHYVIIDEGHRIKNASCKLNADLKQYHSSHRLLLTGTPLQNNLEELWALLNFLLPNIFNSSVDFSQWFNKPFESSGDSSPDEALLSEEENLLIINRLHQVLRPFVLRRLKHKVENELPEKIERLVRCEASAYQKLLMTRVEENLGAIGTSKARSVHNSVMELRNICNHPYLSQLHVEEVHDFIPKHYLPNIVRLCGKLEMLDRLLPKLKATDHRVLLFSTMTRLLDVMEDYLCWKQYKYLRLDGHTSGGDRGALIDQFNKPGSPYFIFLLSIRAGGVGVNLQAADTVIIFDTDWNPQVDLQAQARAHRIGQKREVLVLRFETVQTVEEQVRAAAEHKLGVANQSITAGFFDNNTSAEDRREYLESLLRECKKEEVAPVLHDDALNDLIARSESEIDVFESIDKRRQEEEMATWKLILGQGTNGSDPVFALPSRLLTVDDLKTFCEAMKLSDTPTPVVVSSLGVKRKSEYLGGLDTQHYGRGKRAREVRSYEEQWTEDEFEKMCQVESPQSPKLKDEVKDLNLQVVANESFKVGVKTEAMVPSEQPTNPPLEHSAVPPLVQSVQPFVQSAHPPPQQPVPPPPMQPVQHPLLQPTQQSNEVTPPSKRGRGRPKRVTSQISPSQMVVPAPSAAGSIDVGSHRGPISACLVAPGSDSSPSSATVTSIAGTSHQFGVLIAPSSQASATLPFASPGIQSTAIPCSSIPVPDKRRGRKAHPSVGETPRRRGRKPSMVSSATSVLPSPSGTDNSTMRSQGEIFSSSSFTPGPDCVSGLVSAKPVSKESDSPVPVLLPSSGTIKLSTESQEPVFSSPMFSNSSILTGSSGTTHDLGVGTSGSQTTLALLHVPTRSQSVSIGIDPSSQPNPPFSVPYGPQSVPPSHSVPKQVKGRGRKAQSEVEAPRRRGRKQGAVTTVVPDRSVGQESTSIEPPEKKSRVSGGRKAIATRSKQKNEAHKLMNVIQSETSNVHTFDGIAGLDTALTEESYDSAQNKQGTSSSVAMDVAAKSLDNASANVKVSQLDASVNSRDGSLSTKMESCQTSADLSTTEIHVAGVKDVAPAIKEIKSDTQPSEVKIFQSSRIEGGNVPTLGVSKPSLLEVSATQSSDSKTYSALSTLGTESVCDLTIGMCGTESGKEGVEKVDEMIRAPSGDIVTPNPEIDDSESKRKADVLVSSTTVSEQLTDLRSGTDGNLGGPTMSETLTDITENQSLGDNKTNSASSTLGTDSDSDLVKVGSPSEKEGGEKVEVVFKPLHDGSVAPMPEVHKSESQRNAADCVQNIADSEIFIKERSFGDNGKSVEEKNSVINQVVSYAEDKLVAVNDAMVLIRESVNSYEEKVALDRKGKAVVRNLGAEYKSEKAVGWTNEVASDEDGAGIVGEKLLVLNDVMLNDGNNVVVNADEQLDATVDVVVSPKDGVKDYVAREGVDAEREFEAKELSESKGESGVHENKEGKHDLAASGGIMDVGESKSSEELGEVIHVVTEHETRDRPGVGELHGIAETAIEIHQPTMNLLVGQDELVVEEGKRAGTAEYNKQGEFKSEVERGCLDTKEENDDPAAVESTMEQIEKEPSKDDMGAFQGKTQHGRREQQGDAILHAAVGETVVEIGQTSKEILMEQVQVKEVGYTGISKAYSKEADFKQVKRGCLDTKEEKDDLAVVESTLVQIEKEPSKDGLGVFQGETQNSRRELQGDAILHAAIWETIVEIGKTSKELLIEQRQVKEVGYTGISMDCSKETDLKQVEKGDPEFVEEKHHLSETGFMEGSKAKPSERVKLVSHKVIQNERREQEGRVVDANRETIAEFGEMKMEVDGGLGQTQAKEAGAYTGDLEECSNQEGLEEFRQEVWQDEKGVHETIEKRHDPAAGGTEESEAKPPENVKVYEGVTTEYEKKEKEGRGVLQATGDTTVEIKQTMEELLVRQCLSKVAEEVFQHASEPDRRDRGGEALHSSEGTITIIEQTKNELVEHCQIREDKAEIFEKVKAVFEEIIQHERREQQRGGVRHATVEALAKIGQTAKEIDVDHCQTQAEVKADEKVEAFLEATEPERTENVDDRVFLAVGETVTEFGLMKEELLVEHHTRAEQIIPCKKVEVFQGESAHDRSEQHEDRVLHTGAESTAEFGKTTEEIVVLCQPETKEAKPDKKADDVFQEAAEHERREHLEGGLWHAIVGTVGEIRQTMEEPLVEPCKFLAEPAKPSEIVKEVMHAGAETIVEIGQIAEEVPVEQCQTLVKDDSEVEVLHAAAETTVEIGQRSEELPADQCQTRAQEDSEFAEKVEEVPHAETTVEIGQRLEELPVEQCQTQAQEDFGIFEKVEEVLHTGAGTTVEIGQIAEEVPVEQCQTRAKGDSEVEVLHAGADAIVEIEQRSEELPVEQCQTRAKEDSEPSEIVEVLHADAETTVEIGQRSEECPVQQCRTRVEEDSKFSEKVEEVLHAGAETTVEIGQRSEKRPVEQCQARAKEDSEPSEKVEVLHAGAETTVETGQRSEDIPVEHCQTQSQVDSEFSEKVEEVLRAGAETTVEIEQRSKELPIEQCETRVEEDSEPSERIEEHAGAKTTVEIEQISEELPFEQCQIQAEEDLELSERVEEVLHTAAENEVQIGRRLEELPIVLSQARVKEDSELSEKVEKVLQEESAHDSQELQEDRALHVGAETTVEIGQRLEELHFKHCQNQAEYSESSEKIEVFQESTEHERREQLEAEATKVRLTTDQPFLECQAQVEAAKPSEEVEEVLQEEYAENRKLQHGCRELHIGADTTVDIGQRSEELPVEHGQTRATEDFEPAEKAEVLHEETEHERMVELGSILPHAIEETADIVEQNMESLVGQSRTRAEVPVKLSDKVEVFQKATEHERMEQEESGISHAPGDTVADIGKMKLEGLVECQTELKEADQPDDVKEVFQKGPLNEEMEQAGIVLHNVGETVAEVGKSTKELIESGESETQEKKSASTGISEDSKKEE